MQKMKEDEKLSYSHHVEHFRLLRVSCVIPPSLRLSLEEETRHSIFFVHHTNVVSLSNQPIKAYWPVTTTHDKGNLKTPNYFFVPFHRSVFYISFFACRSCHRSKMVPRSSERNNTTMVGSISSKATVRKQSHST